MKIEKPRKRDPDTSSSPANLLAEDDYQRFQDYFYQRTGIIFGKAKRPSVERRLIASMATAGVNGMRSYLASLRFEDANGTELQGLVNALTVNETYFYREEYQFRCLVASILPELTATPAFDRTHPIRIWSLPCSTGEEPYSLAIQLLENWRQVDDFDVEIIGSDIDTRVLEDARAGLYDQRSVQHLTALIKSRYFDQTPDGRWQVRDFLRASVDFGILNIQDRTAMRRHREKYDVIFCRNLLIYFDDVSRRSAAEALYDSLRPGGFVCLGHSESMSRITPLFTVRKFPDAIIYQKPYT